MSAHYVQAIDNLMKMSESDLANVAVCLAKRNPEMFNSLVSSPFPCDQRIVDWVIAGSTLQAIKLHRKLYNTSLCEAKKAVDVIKEFYEKKS